jgi:hypothetical protein
MKKIKKVNKAKLLKKLKVELWALAKDYCRKRWGNSCYTCNKKGLSGGNWHTSHAIPSCICPFYLDYHWMNLRPACYFCNIHGGGNGFLFHHKLKEEHGQEYINILIDMLENPIIEVATIEDYQNYILKYKQLIKDLRDEKGTKFSA